jgi:dipeptidyl aminopeptidase/acylaminoacyl peptidase
MAFIKTVNKMCIKILIAGLFLPITLCWADQSPDKYLQGLLNKVSCAAFDMPDTVSDFESHAKENYQIKDIQLISCDGRKINAYVVRPIKSVKHQAAILYVHWLDPSAADSNRDEFLDEAKIMAAKGFSSLLVSTFWSIPGGYYMERRWQDDYQSTLYQLKDLQQAIAVLRSIPDVDSKKLIYVGHDYGATFGAMLLGIDESFGSAVLMAGIADITDWYLYGSKTGSPEGKAREDYKKTFNLINPQDLISYSTAALFFQYSSKDVFISKEQAEALYKKASKGSRVEFYDVDHSLKTDTAKLDRIKWIQKQ